MAQTAFYIKHLIKKVLYQQYLKINIMQNLIIILVRIKKQVKQTS